MRAALLCALLVLAGCTATKESQVRSALLEAGVPPTTAHCMAQPMARDLSTAQLRSIARVAQYARGKGRDLTEGQILDIFRRDLDPQTLGVIMRAGIGCFLRG